MLFPVSGFNTTVPNKARVYKRIGIGCDHCRPKIDDPWTVVAPHWEPQYFATWEEAIALASTWRPPIYTAFNKGVYTVNEVRRREGWDAA